MRRAILNVATGGWYPAGQQRLFDSIEERGDNATRLFWRDQLPPGSPTHEKAPYAFKPYAFLYARTLGFDQALWMDASCWAIRPLDTVWGRMDEHGWWLEPDGHMVGEWISDVALELLGLSRDEVMRMPLIEGKLIGLDFRNRTACRFLNEWVAIADAGGFNGPWTNENGQASMDGRCRGHRHDIACGSPVVHRLGMRMQTAKTVGFPENGEPGSEIAVLAQGM
jgi:hypothetical protein